MSAFVVVACLLAATASAQDRSHWGVVFSLAPEHSWRAIPELAGFLFEPGERVEVKSTDFRIGIARGRTLGGDWGVSYVRRNLADGSRFDSTSSDFCPTTNQCITIGEFALTRGVTQIGVEVHKFIPFVTIKRRAQIGLNVAGGVSKFEGTVESHELIPEVASFDPRTGQVTYRVDETVSTRQMSELPSFSPFPFGKVEIAGAAIIVPGLKIRASGGFDFPGYTVFSLTGVILFGSR